ncbi:MAG: N-(5'-phosphoribosyl)anthranilate isomerase [Syntrophus sp. PtaB.Bin001]|nr:MAG: N-(5'-phosphoribosyl)anthranilate isomerase [Syntrophus sp. PtaB.Bin001]
MTRIKICGIMTEEDIRLCVAASVEALGFVVEYPVVVPWNLDRQTAEELMRKAPPFVSRVIVVGDDHRTVVELTELLRPHVVQLHGNEPISATADLVSAIHELGVQAIKPLRFSVETGKCRSSCEDPVDAALLIEDTGVDGLVLDSVSDSRPAGTGKSIDWGLARKIRNRVRVPVILAGGLHPGNVGEAITAIDPYGVDVISGVEDPARRKDPEKLKAFVKAVRDARFRPE